jgi:hypothetical protein
MAKLRFLFLMLSGLALADCGGKNNQIGLAVDLYLHPEAARAEDLILQAAIRKRLSEDELTRPGSIHVRVIEDVVFLSGAVKSAAAKDQAAKIAQDTEVILNGQSIKPTEPVRNLIEVQGR